MLPTEHFLLISLSFRYNEALRLFVRWKSESSFANIGFCGGFVRFANVLELVGGKCRNLIFLSFYMPCISLIKPLTRK